MAEQQTQDPQPDKAKGRPPSEAGVRAENRSFAREGDGARPVDEFVGTARDLSQKTAEATREVGVRGREAALEFADSWRTISEPFLAMHADMSRFIDDLWRQAGGFGMAAPLRRAHPFAAMSPAPLLGLPPVDMKETETAYVLHAELPGLTREDIDVEVRGGMLLLAGHKAEDRDDHGAAYRISERRFGRFERIFPLPPQVDPGRIEARFREGVLTITLPKTARATEDNSKVEIKT
jgi:HSP20 family protein